MQAYRNVQIAQAHWNTLKQGTRVFILNGHYAGEFGVVRAAQHTGAVHVRIDDEMVVLPMRSLTPAE